MMGNLATGIDVGAHGMRALQLQSSRGGFKLRHFFAQAHQLADIQSSFMQASEACPWKWQKACVGITGREVMLRYSKVPPLPDIQLRKLMRFEIADLAARAGGDLCADFNLLPIPTDFAGNDTVLLALVKNSLLEFFLELQTQTTLSIHAFSPNTIALYNAYLCFAKPSKEAVLLANVGAENVDLVLIDGRDLVFARNASVPLGAMSQLSTLLEATPVLAKSQIQYAHARCDRVLLCGGGARVNGLVQYLHDSLGKPVEFFDPFAVIDCTAVTAQELALLDKFRLESVIALGLAAAQVAATTYSLEILLPSMQRKREFLNKNIYRIAAGLFVLLYLGADWLWSSRQATQAFASLQQARQTVKQRHLLEQKIQNLQEKNTALAQQSEMLGKKLSAGAALVKTQQILQEILPKELFIDALAVEARTGKDEDLQLATERIPIIRIEGRGQEGRRPLAEVFQEFTQGIRASIPGAAVKQTTTTRDGFTFRLEINYFAATDHGL